MQATFCKFSWLVFLDISFLESFPLKLCLKKYETFTCLDFLHRLFTVLQLTIMMICLKSLLFFPYCLNLILASSCRLTFFKSVTLCFLEAVMNLKNWQWPKEHIEHLKCSSIWAPVLHLYIPRCISKSVERAKTFNINRVHQSPRKARDSET